MRGVTSTISHPIRMTRLRNTVVVDIIYVCMYDVCTARSHTHTVRRDTPDDITSVRTRINQHVHVYSIHHNYRRQLHKYDYMIRS